MARVVLIEPFYGGSHRVWADGWIAESAHEIELISHPGESWRWRLRGAAVTLAEALAAEVSRAGEPDVVVVSGMVDLAALAGLARTVLHGVPLVLYLHESQLLYPLAPGQRSDTSLDLAAWRSMLAADEVWFNSEFHRRALRDALPQLLEGQPEPRHGHLLDRVFERSRVLWPGVETVVLSEGERDHATRPPRVLWNQRWAHDKKPDVVFGALGHLAGQGIDFTLTLAGEGRRPDQLDALSTDRALGSRIEDIGFLPRDRYHPLLLRSDVVVSAAVHEFFGIAVVEAMAAGAVPLLPNRLSYPELIDPTWRDAVLYEDDQLVARLGALLRDVDHARRRVDGLRASMCRFDVTRAAAAHDLAVEELLARALPSRHG